MGLTSMYLFIVVSSLVKAHGGYSFCGLAALKLLGKEKLCNVDLLTVSLV